jgi:integrase
MTSQTLLLKVEDYLAVRRGLGFELKSAEKDLRQFVRYADRVGHQGPLTIDLAVAWARWSRSADPAQAAKRLVAVRAFARYLTALDPATEVPPIGLLGPLPRRRQPHIYSDTEIAALLARSSRLLPRRGLRPRTYVTLFSLLVSTGLRLSEACRLQLDDVDLADGVITVRQGKFRKARLVPLHPTMTQALNCYATERDVALSGCFFRTDHAPALKPDTVQKTFSRLRTRLGWTAQGRARLPRVHDLRHTFAVRRLLRWHAAGVDLDRKMLALSTYLGHAKPSHTYWYLEAVPELMAITAERFEHFARQPLKGAS